MQDEELKPNITYFTVDGLMEAFANDLLAEYIDENTEHKEADDKERAADINSTM